MTDPTPPTPLDNAPGTQPEAQPNYIARSALGIMRRAERALSPWSRRLFQAESAAPGTLQRSPDRSTAPTPRSPLLAVKNPSVSAKAALTLAHRAQRAEMPTIIQRSPESRTAHSLENFASKVIQRFPEVAAKYTPKTAQTSDTVQRASLPFVGSESAASESSDSGPSIPAVAMPADEGESSFYPSVSTQESVASQLAERLQTFRDQSDSTPSPREISRKTAERAARPRTTPSNQTTIRRSSVEEIGPRTLPSSAPAEEAVPSAPRETIQRKPVEQPNPEPQAPRPTSDPAPRPPLGAPARPAQSATPPQTIQRTPETPSQAASSSETDTNIGPRPGLPSLSQQLLQRLQAGRDEWDAESSEPDSALPSFLKSSAPAPTPPTTVQRKAEPKAPPVPPAIEHRESRPVRPAAQPQSAQTVQRKPQAEPSKPADELPLHQKPPTEPPVESPPSPSIQRASEEPKAASDSEPSVSAEPLTPEAPKAASVSDDLPLASPQASVQRQPSIEPAPETPVSAVPSTPPPTPTGHPAIQRTAESPNAEPAPSAGPRSPELSVESEPTLPEASIPQSPQAAAQPPAIQRSSESLPLRAPTPPLTLPTAESNEDVTPKAQASIPSVDQSLSLSAPPSVQRKPEAAARVSETLRPERPVEVTEPVAAPGQNLAAQSVQRQTIIEVRQTDMPLATPRGVVPTPASVAPAIQRMPDGETPTPVVMPLVAQREPAPVPQTSAKPMAIVQRKPAEAATATIDRPLPKLPLARVAPSASTQIQRELSTDTSTTTASTTAATDQSTRGTSTEDSKKSTTDLNDLARRIYPILKRMLAIERERR